MAKASAPTDSDMVGKKAPAFTLPDQEGKKHKLSDYKGKNVVLFFYPKDDTPGFGFTHKNALSTPDTQASVTNGTKKNLTTRYDSTSGS